jgi:hypothetical protein
MTNPDEEFKAGIKGALDQFEADRRKQRAKAGRQLVSRVAERIDRTAPRDGYAAITMTQMAYAAYHYAVGEAVRRTGTFDVEALSAGSWNDHGRYLLSVRGKLAVVAPKRDVRNEPRTLGEAEVEGVELVVLVDTSLGSPMFYVVPPDELAQADAFIGRWDLFDEDPESEVGP